MTPSMLNHTIKTIADSLHQHAYCFVEHTAMQTLLENTGALNDWSLFTESWNHLAMDTYMADHGRYRRRRHAVFASNHDGDIVKQAHQAHFQTLNYNPLNGDIQRWFEPVLAEILDTSSLKTLLHFCKHLFQSLAPETKRWHIEAHQFRIEALADIHGQPTPEGMHRDGVDYVMVLLIKRHNIASGTTMIGALDGSLSSSFTLSVPFDAALVDDQRAYHGVTPVQALDPNEEAYRDVLVLTFKKVSVD
jgi:hypothetical protein